MFQHFQKMLQLFVKCWQKLLKILGRKCWNIRKYCPIVLKNVAIFCKMLKKSWRNRISEKCWKSTKMFITKMLVPKILQNFVKYWRKWLEMLKRKMLWYFKKMLKHFQFHSHEVSWWENKKRTFRCALVDWKFIGLSIFRKPYRNPHPLSIINPLLEIG
jgi:hypothetical protein